jgi:hypothetical protein
MAPGHSVGANHGSMKKPKSSARLPGTAAAPHLCYDTSQLWEPNQIQ